MTPLISIRVSQVPANRSTSFTRRDPHHPRNAAPGRRITPELAQVWGKSRSAAQPPLSSDFGFARCSRRTESAASASCFYRKFVPNVPAQPKS
ncbi:hypothetical protein EJB05_37801, partial [Eragrostis curvula]